MEPQTTASSGAANGDAALPEADPRHCVLLRAGGLLSVLDMNQVWLLCNLGLAQGSFISGHCQSPHSAPDAKH